MSRALAEAGLSVPRDISMVGFDDIPMARFAAPPLTTVAQDTTRAGELLVETLLRQVRDETTESTTLPVSLVVRRSCGVQG
jgi:DNA-binding LacI/PurR family transcriptional regulator